MEKWKIIMSVVTVAVVLLIFLWIEIVWRMDHYRRQRRNAFRHGIRVGYQRRQRELIHAKRVELHDAQRLADERPDAGPSARIAPVRIQRRYDT